MVLKFEELVRTFCYDCENNSSIKCNHCFDMYKEKNMLDKIEINVKINGKDVPLHEVSEQTLLTIKENSKPKPVPAFQIVNCSGDGQRLIFKVTDDIATKVGKYIALDSNGKVCNYGLNMKALSVYGNYSNLRELKLEEL